MEAAGGAYALAGEVDQLQQVRGAGVAVAEGGFDEDLRLFQVLHGPPHADAQGVHLRRQLAD